MTTSYKAFLAAKVVSAPLRGFEISEADVNPACQPHVRAIVPWMVRLGRAPVTDPRPCRARTSGAITYV